MPLHVHLQKHNHSHANCYKYFSLALYFSANGHLQYLHSFPTRRSSDLGLEAVRWPGRFEVVRRRPLVVEAARDRKSTRLNSSHVAISYAVFCLKKKK